MGTILTYSADRRRRAASELPREGTCQIIIFTGVRIERVRPERTLPPPATAARPKPGRGA